MTRIAHLNGLRALEAAVRLGSFTAAGAELGVTPAAIGQQVRKLERALGRNLLIRRPNGFEPTDVARLASSRLAAGLAEMREAVAMLSGSAARLGLSVTVVPTIAERWLAPRLADFLGAHPEVDLRIDSTHHVHYRASAEYDFALRYDPPGSSGFREIALFRESLLPVCTPDLARRIPAEAGPEALAGMPLIDVDPSTSDPDWIGWEEWGARFGYRIPQSRQGLRFTFTTLALRAAYDGHGVFLAQLSITLPDIISGRMVAPFGPQKTVRTGFPYRLIVLNPARRSRLHKPFADWILAEAAKTRAAMDGYLAG